MTECQFRDDSCIRIRPRILFNQVEGEAVILNLDSGIYYGLDEVGTRVWKLIENGGTLAAIRNVLVDEYEVSPTQLWADLVMLLEQMQQKGLVEVSTSDSSST
ncbi:MAG: PqqD family protein [Acidobacteria bacterium]|nr:PqqD family protein [Acidobacteriota bacterium]